MLTLYWSVCKDLCFTLYWYVFNDWCFTLYWSVCKDWCFTLIILNSMISASQHLSLYVVQHWIPCKIKVMKGNSIQLRWERNWCQLGNWYLCFNVNIYVYLVGHVEFTMARNCSIIVLWARRGQPQNYRNVAFLANCALEPMDDGLCALS